MEEDSDTIEQEEHFQARPTIRIVMPDNLKALLVDDWERVTKNFSVVKLPAPRPIREILQAYRADEVPQRNRFDLQVLDTNLAGLTEYFEVAIGKVLLYNYERHQYRLLRKKYKGIKGKSPVNIFGAEHLIRMFSEFPPSPSSLSPHVLPQCLFFHFANTIKATWASFWLRPTWATRAPVASRGKSPSSPSG